MKVTPVNFMQSFTHVSALKKLQVVHIADTRSLAFSPRPISASAAQMVTIKAGSTYMHVPSFRNLDHFAGFVLNLYGDKMANLIQAGFMPLAFKDDVAPAQLNEMAAVKNGLDLALYYVSDLKLYALGDEKHGACATETPIWHNAQGEALRAFTLGSGELLNTFAAEKTEPNLFQPITPEVLLCLPETSKTGGEQGMVDLGFAAGITGKGSRDSNEDGFLIHKDPDSGKIILIIADGLGGYNAGETASQIGIQTVYTKLLQGKEIFNSVKLADWQIHVAALKSQGNDGMATTIDAVTIDGNIARIGHVGDSFVYRVKKDGTVALLTKPHTVAVGNLMGISFAATMPDFAERCARIKLSMDKLAPDLSAYLFDADGKLKIKNVPEFKFPLEGDDLKTFHLLESLFPASTRGMIAAAIGHGTNSTIDEIKVELDDGDWLVEVSDGMKHAVDHFMGFEGYLSELRREGKSIQEGMRMLYTVASQNWGDNVTAVLYEHRKTGP